MSTHPVKKIELERKLIQFRELCEGQLVYLSSASLRINCCITNFIPMNVDQGSVGCPFSAPKEGLE